MDFSAWIEVFLDGQWRTFDPRNNVPRIGRIVIARGRDAADIPLINSFGPHVLKSFRVWTYEVISLPTDERAARELGSSAAPDAKRLQSTVFPRLQPDVARGGAPYPSRFIFSRRASSASVGSCSANEPGLTSPART